jgi:hypothetical protein
MGGCGHTLTPALFCIPYSNQQVRWMSGVMNATDGHPSVLHGVCPCLGRMRGTGTASPLGTARCIGSPSCYYSDDKGQESMGQVSSTLGTASTTGWDFALVASCAEHGWPQEMAWPIRKWSESAPYALHAPRTCAAMAQVAV